MYGIARMRVSAQTLRRERSRHSRSLMYVCNGGTLVLKGVRLLGCRLFHIILTGLLSERGYINTKDVRYRRNEEIGSGRI